MDQDAGWLAQLLGVLERSGSDGRSAWRFLQQRNIAVSVHDQPTAARWTLGRRIQIHPRYTQGSPEAPYPLSLVIHEVRHLQQGLVTALSVYGELDAWQAQFNFIGLVEGRFHEQPERHRIIADLLSLPLCWDRSVLTNARALMLAYAGKAYRLDLLPLYPLHREVLFWLTGHSPGGSHKAR